MNRLEFDIDGNPIDTKPENFEGLGVVVDWSERNNIKYNFDSLVFRNEPAEQIIAMRGDNLGSFVGRPFGMKVSGFQLPELMINLRKNFKRIGGNECQVSVDALHQRDWIQERGGSIAFRRLEDEGKFLPTDFAQVPYNINYIPDGFQLVMLSITTYQVLNASIQLIKETANSVSEGTTALIPAVGVGSVITVGQIALAVAKIAIRAIYFISLAIALKKLIEQIANELYSPTRYHTAIYERSLLRVGLAEIGLTLESDLFNEDVPSRTVIMPSKTEKGRKNINIKNNGAPSRKDNGLYFLGEFIETMLLKYNADYRIVNGVFRFERWDWWRNNSSVVIDNNWTNQERRLDEFTDNAADFKGGYFISFAMDTKDQNTYDQYYGTCYDVITNNIVTTTKPYDLSGGSTVIDLPIALGVRKDTLTRFEEALKVLFKLVDGVTSIFGNGTNFVAKINNRTGNLHLSDHFTSMPKNIVISNGLLQVNQRDQLNAMTLWQQYHYINSFFPIGTVHNQWEIYSMKMRMTKNIFVNLLNNNYVQDSEGNDIEVQRLEWMMEEDEAFLDLRINRQYTFNLRQSYVISENTQYANNDSI